MAAEPFDHHAHGSRKRMDVRVSSGSASMRAAELVKPHSASASNNRIVTRGPCYSTHTLNWETTMQNE
jgi:hypothetical protein